MSDKIDLDKDVNLNADELEQVKGGALGISFTKIGDIKGEKDGISAPTTQVAGYDLKAAKKV